MALFTLSKTFQISFNISFLVLTQGWLRFSESRHHSGLQHCWEARTAVNTKCVDCIERTPTRHKTSLADALKQLSLWSSALISSRIAEGLICSAKWTRSILLLLFLDHCLFVPAKALCESNASLQPAGWNAEKF